MRRGRRGPALTLAVVALCGVTACSSSQVSGASPPATTTSALPLSTDLTASPSPSPQATTPALVPNRYEQLLLDDGARGLWPLRDVTPDLRFGDELADLSSPLTPAVDVDGLIKPTPGPTLLGEKLQAAAFTARGRIVTNIRSGFSSDKAFTVEAWFRADGCSNSWGRAAGTETTDAKGREGVSVFFYPKLARQPCRLGVEIWHANAFVLGCPTGITAPAGQWVHIAASYQSGTLSCYRNGVLSERQRKPGAVFLQTAPFDIGSAGSGVAGNLSSGSLAQVAVYETALAPARIAAHAKAAS